MAPRIHFRRSYPADEDDSPVQTPPSTPTRKLKRAPGPRKVRFADASTETSDLLASMAAGARLAPISEDVASSWSSNFADASEEDQASLTSRQVEEKQIMEVPVESRSYEKAEESSIRTVNEAPASPLSREKDMASSHSSVRSIQGPRFAAASPDFQSIFASMAIGKKDVPSAIVELVKSERMEEPKPQPNAEVATPLVEYEEATPSPIDTDTKPFQTPECATASVDCHSAFAKPEFNSVETGKSAPPEAQPAAEVPTRPEVQDASSSPLPKDIETLGNPKFLAASLEYHAIFASMAIRKKLTSVAPEEVEGSVAKPDAEAATKPEVNESSLTILPKAFKLEKEEETVANSNLKGPMELETEGERVPPIPNDSVEFEQTEQPIAQNDAKASAQAEPGKGSPRSNPVKVETFERPKFAAASPEFWDMFTSMAIGRNLSTVEPERTVESTLLREPGITAPIEAEQIEEIVVDLGVEEHTQPGTERDDLPPASTNVEPLEKPRFAAASPECWNIFASMAIGAKPNHREVVIAYEGNGSQEGGRAHSSTTEDESAATTPQDDSQAQSPETATADPVIYQSPNVTIEDELAPDNLPITSNPPITGPSTPNTPVTSSSQASRIPSSTPAPQPIKFAVESPEFQTLFASMAIPTNPVSEKNGLPTREYASEPHTPQRVASPTGHQEYKFPSPPSTPEKKVSLSVRSSPHRRPATTDLVARRLIGAALGIRMATKKDEKTTTIKKALGMKDKGEGKAMWEEYVAGIEK